MGNDKASMRGTNVKSAGGGGAGLAEKAQFTGHEKLTPAQREAVMKYQEAENGVINGHLRDGGTLGTVPYWTKDTARELDVLTNRGRINMPTTLYRGWTLEQGTGGLPANLFVGRIMQDPGFLSTSTKRNIGEKFAGSFNGVVMRVRMPAGSKGLHVQAIGASAKYTTGKEAEHEVLLPRGTKFRVKSAKRRKDGVLVLDAEVYHG
jgi:hypothetical protein